MPRRSERRSPAQRPRPPILRSPSRQAPAASAARPIYTRSDVLERDSVNVLFVCVGNSGRSVMAERLFRKAAGGRHEARSAGADPHRETAEPAVVEALAEVGIDASDHRAHKLEQADIDWADVV